MTKNKGGIIPDIIAVKKKTAVFFENKDRYVESDFEKIRKIKSSGKYSEGLSRLLKQFASDTLFFGIAYASSINDDQRGLKNLENIDFLLTVNINSSINILSDPFKLFSE
jgi:Holliday junction resolvase